MSPRLHKKTVTVEGQISSAHIYVNVKLHAFLLKHVKVFCNVWQICPNHMTLHNIQQVNRLLSQEKVDTLIIKILCICGVDYGNYNCEIFFFLYIII